MARAVIASLASRRWGRVPELGPGYVAAALRAAGHEATLVHIDAEEPDSVAEACRHVARLHPTLLGISCSHAAVPVRTYRSLGATLAAAVHPRPHLTTGGYFATFHAERLLADWPELDSVIVGEGEAPAVALAHCLDEGRPPEGLPGVRARHGRSAPTAPPAALDELPTPVRAYLGEPDMPALVSVSTSRGCLAHCTFCNVPRWTGRSGGWRGRSPDAVGDEVRALVASGARRLWIVDSSFEDPLPAGWERMRAIAAQIAKCRPRPTFYVFMRAESVASAAFGALVPELVSHGLRRVFVGVESGQDPLLARMAKVARVEDARRAVAAVRDAGITVRIGFILFTPTATFDTLRSDVRFLEAIGSLHLPGDLCTRLELYTGAAEVARVRNLGLLDGDPYDDPFCYRFTDARIARLAAALSRVRDRSDLSPYWEALHDARLLANGSALHAGVGADPVTRAASRELRQEVAALEDLMAQTDRTLIERAFAWAEHEGPDAEFREIEHEWFDTVLPEVATTATAMARAFAGLCLSRGVDVGAF